MNQSDLTRKRITAILLGLSVIICLVFLGYALNQKERARNLERSLDSSTVELAAQRAQIEKGKAELAQERQLRLPK